MTEWLNRWPTPVWGGSPKPADVFIEKSPCGPGLATLGPRMYRVVSVDEERKAIEVERLDREATR